MMQEKKHTNCPFCDEEIKIGAIKCRHCKKMLPSPAGMELDSGAPVSAEGGQGATSSPGAGGAGSAGAEYESAGREEEGSAGQKPADGGEGNLRGNAVSACPHCSKMIMNCPHCGEVIKGGALKCRHCKKMIAAE